MEVVVSVLLRIVDSLILGIDSLRDTMPLFCEILCKCWKNVWLEGIDSFLWKSFCVLSFSPGRWHPIARLSVRSVHTYSERNWWRSARHPYQHRHFEVQKSLLQNLSNKAPGCWQSDAIHYRAYPASRSQTCCLVAEITLMLLPGE